MSDDNVLFDLPNDSIGLFDPMLDCPYWTPDCVDCEDCPMSDGDFDAIW